MKLSQKEEERLDDIANGASKATYWIVVVTCLALPMMFLLMFFGDYVGLVYKIGLFALLLIFPILYVYGWYTKSDFMGDWFWLYNYTTDEGMVSFTHLLSILAIHYFFVFLLNGLFASHIVNYDNLQKLIKISEENGSLPNIGRNVDRASVVLRKPQENSGTPETRTAPSFSEK